MKHFINQRSDVVTDAVDATVALAGGALARLDGFPSIKVVVRADRDRSSDTVALVSGGGSGHEPAHAGFVGDGMLTAAVCGEIFASPSVDAVLAAIVAVTGPRGCLVIVKNYTGDRLNFGLAAEKARARGLAVETVFVADDVALSGAARPRGVAGTLFVHKIAGDVARAGGTLAEVKAIAEHVAASTVSIGLALSTCTVPGQEAASRIGAAEVELGLGIHGEPGAAIVPLRPIRELAVTMMAAIDDALDARGGGPAGVPVALLVNDLGGVPSIELAIAADALCRASRREVKLVVGPERLMTSLDMKGISVSALPLDDRLEQALRSSVGPRAWPPARSWRAPAPIPIATAAAAYEPSADAGRRAALERACRTLVALEGELDALDAKVGDGDTGTTLATGARAVLAELDRFPFADAAALCAMLADRLGTVIGGSSGVLLSIFFAAAGAAIGDPPSWPRALRAGAARMQEHGGARAGDRTMLDALLPAIASLEASPDLGHAARAARDGAARTAAMTKAGAGRSSYVREDALRGQPDPGAVAVARVLAALAAPSDPF